MTAMPTLRTIANGTPADATDVEYNFDTIETHVAAELVNRDGSVAMTGALTLPGSPSAANEAATKGYVDSLASKPFLWLTQTNTGPTMPTETATTVSWNQTLTTAGSTSWYAPGGANPERVIPTTAGIYKITFTIKYPTYSSSGTASNDARTFASVLKNGANIDGGSASANGYGGESGVVNNVDPTPTVTCVVTLNGTTDYITCTGYHTDSAAVNFTPSLLVELLQAS